MRFAFRVNRAEIALALRAGEGNHFELIAVDPVAGEFALHENDEIGAREIKLAAALNVQLHGGGWKKIPSLRRSRSSKSGNLMILALRMARP